MNRNTLKHYAPQARRDFIAAVRDRAASYGLTTQQLEPMTEQGEVALIGGKPFPRSAAAKRKRLEERIRRQGFEQVMEAMAYTWFNRLVAIRYMELHGYLEHGYRVLSHPEGKAIPEILEHAEHVDLPRVDTQKVLVNAIDEEGWQEVEIIGWLYQFYISEKKDQVIGKVVKSEDIPAATQLFTPNWIVKYLVQNTLGRQWLATYPTSPLRQQMEYYIEPAGQTPEVQEQLKAITPDSLNPEELTLLDPACGSGHILVEAYDLLKAIYQERGYRLRDIPGLILGKNLYGLEIDDRAAQLAAFALMMKARADDRRIFGSGVQPHVLAIQESRGLDAKVIAEALNAPLDGGEKQGQKGDIDQADVSQLIELFEHGKTFGSLIRVPENLAKKLPEIAERVQAVLAYGGMLEQAVARSLPSFEQVQILAGRYGTVVTNPPYMRTKFYAPTLKTFIRREYKRSQGDLYTCFMIRNLDLAQSNGFIGMITIPNWMFLSSFDELLDDMLRRVTIDTFIHNGRGVFGSDFGSCSFVVRNHCNDLFSGSYRRLFEKQGSVADNEDLEQRFFTVVTYTARQSDFRSISGQPIAYWISERMRQCFRDGTPLGEIAGPCKGMDTGDNSRFLRMWPEVSLLRIEFGISDVEMAMQSLMRWFPYKKGGEYRRWYGNNWWLVDWENGGERIRAFLPRSTIRNPHTHFKSCVTWTDLSSIFFGCRWAPRGFLHDNSGPSAFPLDHWHDVTLGFLCSSVAFQMLRVLNPTMHFQVANIVSLPMLEKQILDRKAAIEQSVDEAVSISRQDWDSFETSWDFQTLPVLQQIAATLAQSQADAEAEALARFKRMKQLEEDNNRLFIDAYGLQDELSLEVPEEQITLYRPNREEDIKRLISYAIGCMMGRYSLDMPGLIYARSGNRGFDPSQYQTFPADADGIIPLTELEWFEDAAANRLEQFIATAWPREHLEENLTFIADSLGLNRNEQPRETIRRYLAIGFYKHHMSMYKRRPIYWLFSSGKQGAFQCLVYLHRYNEGTLSRMRTEYVIPLQGKMASRIGQLADDIAAASSTSHRKNLEKERDTLVKHQAELYTFDEKLRHYADRRISLDLDDGVKVNYGKFGDLLAEVKAVTGGTKEP